MDTLTSKKMGRNSVLIIGFIALSSIVFLFSIAFSSIAYANAVIPGGEISAGDDGNEYGNGNGGGGSWDGGGSTTTPGGGTGTGGGGSNGSNFSYGSTVRCDPLGGACTASYSGPSSQNGLDVIYPGERTSISTCENNGTLVEAMAGFKLSRIVHNLGDREGNREDYFLASAVKSCGYGAWVETAYKKCFYDAVGSGTYSRDINEIKNNGKVLIGKSTILSGSPTSGQHDNCHGSFYHKISVPTADYGYYKLNLSNKFVEWSRKGLMYKGAEIIHKWDRVRDGVNNKSAFYSFSCNADNPYMNFMIGADDTSLHNAFKNAVIASKADKHLDPAACPQTKGRWECTVSDATTIGIDPATLNQANRKDASALSATVMRNGDPVKLTYGQIKISDYNNRGEEKVISEGQSGTVVKNLRHVSYRDSIVGRSSNKVAAGTPATPWKANKDVNAKDQYFARYVNKNNKMTSANFSTDWDKWIYKNANDNRNYLMSFNWASDQGAPFATTREYQVTADFLVPSGSSGGMNEDGSFTSGALKYDWKQDTRICFEKTGSGGNLNETKNPVFSKSNKVDVMRATSQNG